MDEAPSPGDWKRVTLRLRQLLSLGIILALLGAGCSSGGQLGAKALLQQSKSLQSEAAEGSLLAQDVVSGKTTSIYTHEHASDLFMAASQAEASLKVAETEPALARTLRRLVSLASQVSADLERLGNASNAEARGLARDLQAAAQASRQIGELLA
jgi:hypothetical protein